MGSDGAPIVDPRRGDVGDDAASTKQRSLLAIAGSLLVEISVPKLLFAWTVSLVLPAILLGLAPLVATGWLVTMSGHLAPKACVILSGLLNHQAASVVGAYRARGLVPLQHLKIEGWSSLLLRSLG